METSKIKALLSAIKNKSLSKAAEEFGYTPSALSHIADSLEEELGVTILKRTPMGVELTKEGQIVCEKLENVILAEKELFSTISNLSLNDEVEIRIGTYSSIAQYVLPELLKSFKKDYPQTKVTIKVGNNLKLWLEEDVADIVFCDEAPQGKTEWVPFIKDDYVAVLPSTAYVNKKTINKEELYKNTYVSINEGRLKKYFDESKFKEILSYDSVDENSVISMVKEGIGITVLPSMLVKKPPKGVKTLKLEPEISRTIGVAYKTSKKSSPTIKQFIKHVKSFGI